MTADPAAFYKSQAQRAKVVTEAWAEQNLFCPHCPSPKLDHPEKDDFSCPRCGARFQLKVQKTRIGASMTDGSYPEMIRAIRRGKAPGFFVMYYDAEAWTVRDLLLVPGFALVREAIVKGPGGVGCRIRLDRLAPDARIAMVTTIKSAGAGDTECIMIARPEEVREKCRPARRRAGKAKV